MLIYLDSNIVIYAIEQPAYWGTQALARIAGIRAAQDKIVLSDLTRLECRIKPFALNDLVTLAQFDAFFSAVDVQVVSLNAAVCDRATEIRARQRFKLGDALNLAAAVVHCCDVFLTGDARLSGFSGCPVEILT